MLKVALNTIKPTKLLESEGHVRYCHLLASVIVVCKLLHFNLLWNHFFLHFISEHNNEKNMFLKYFIFCITSPHSSFLNRCKFWSLRYHQYKQKYNKILWNHFYSWGTSFCGWLIHEIKNPTNNETWEAVWHRYIAMLSSSDLNFLDQLHRGQLTILMTK
jgi:hypothetical protein